jgi:hypothetical protein
MVSVFRNELRLLLPALGTLSATLGVWAPQSQAVPMITGDLTIVENRPVDDFLGFSGLHLLLRVDATHPGGSAQLTGGLAGATVETNNNQFPFANPTTLSFFDAHGSGGSWSQLYAITPADLPDVEGRYDYTVTDSSGASDMHEGNNLNRAAVVPHPTNLAVSNFSTTPLFTFTDPDPDPAFDALDRVYNMVIFNSAGDEIAILPSPTMGSSTPEIQVPAGLLTAGQQYWFRAQSNDVDTSDFRVENIGESLLSFTAVPEASQIMTLGAIAIGPIGLRLRRWVSRRARSQQRRSAP